MGSFNDIFNGRIREWSLGSPESVTVASGVLTIPAGSRSFIKVIGESGALDTVDSISKADAKPGDLLLFTISQAGDITFDDANINLGDTTRALTGTDGSYLLVIYDGTSWSELLFINGDNA